MAVTIIQPGVKPLPPSEQPWHALSSCGCIWEFNGLDRLKGGPFRNGGHYVLCPTCGVECCPVAGKYPQTPKRSDRLDSLTLKGSASYNPYGMF